MGSCDTSKTPRFAAVLAKTAWRFASVTSVVGVVTEVPTWICMIVRVLGP